MHFHGIIYLPPCGRIIVERGSLLTGRDDDNLTTSDNRDHSNG